MVILNQYKFIFVHNVKIAGSSITTNLLNQLNDEDKLITQNINKPHSHKFIKDIEENYKFIKWILNFLIIHLMVNVQKTISNIQGKRNNG
ncbi:hypothetical protein N5T79_04035 [Aliarcobacter cryaerophilus]|uniref:hypothetical protein n=1 Tax=Aliarcobacter cryaerophilus TaxID=28198 RepID=UPI0021B63D61|nr:hypothetical protein [Aliarcobacter cryaerophilus]MCT7528302.1 hypothetical protein [Aliarcobacter cryaerophilus]